MQVIQPFFETLHLLNTLPGWRKGYDFIRVEIGNFGKHQQPTSLSNVLLYFKSSSKETSFLTTFGGRNLEDLSQRSLFFHFSKLQRRRSMQSATASHLKAVIVKKKHINIFHHTD